MVAVHHITQSANDKKELLIVVKDLNERLHRDDYVIVVDYGYWHIKSLKAIYHSPTMIVIPDRVAASRTKQKKNEDKNKPKKKKDSKMKIDDEFRKNKFIKDWKNDTYICPNGTILTRRNDNMQNGVNVRFMQQKIASHALIMTIVQQKPKEKSKID